MLVYLHHTHSLYDQQIATVKISKWALSVNLDSNNLQMQV